MLWWTGEITIYKKSSISSMEQCSCVRLQVYSVLTRLVVSSLESWQFGWLSNFALLSPCLSLKSSFSTRYFWVLPFILVASVFKSLTLFLLPPPLQVLLESQEETSTSRACCQHDSVVSQLWWGTEVCWAILMLSWHNSRYVNTWYFNATKVLEGRTWNEGRIYYFL